MTDEQVEKLKKSFEMFDKDGDGIITKQELAEVLNTSLVSVYHRSPEKKPSKAELEDMMGEIDRDKNGTIEFEEFKEMMERRMGGAATADNTEIEIREAFCCFDEDGNGYISGMELRHVLMSLGEKMTDVEVKELIQETDTDGDGRISYEEFVKMSMWSGV